MKTRIAMASKEFKITVSVLLGVFGILFITGLILNHFDKPKTTDTENTDFQITAEEKEKADKIIVGVYKELHTKVLENAGETEMLNYVNSDLEAICPFYQPDGVGYRTCLVELVEKQLLPNFTGTEQQIDEFIEQCLQLTQEYESSRLGFGLYYSCMAYKLR